jgi:hypothetical protein
MLILLSSYHARLWPRGLQPLGWTAGMDIGLLYMHPLCSPNRRTVGMLKLLELPVLGLYVVAGRKL